MDERVKYVATIVSEVTGVSVENIMGKKRTREYANAKVMLCKALNDCFKMGVSDQERNGLGDHSTIIYRLKVWDNHYSMESDFRHDYNTIKNSILTDNIRVTEMADLKREEALCEARLRLIRSKIAGFTTPTHRDEFHVAS